MIQKYWFYFIRKNLFKSVTLIWGLDKTMTENSDHLSEGLGNFLPPCHIKTRNFYCFENSVIIYFWILLWKNIQVGTALCIILWSRPNKKSWQRGQIAQGPDFTKGFEILQRGLTKFKKWWKSFFVVRLAIFFRRFQNLKKSWWIRFI